jgi:hypothetical protein
VVRSSRDGPRDVRRDSRGALDTQIGNRESNSAFFDFLDPEGDVADAPEDVLDQAPWTDAATYDDATLERLFADEVDTDEPIASDCKAGGSRMSEDDAIAVVLRVFPGAQLVGS